MKNFLFFALLMIFCDADVDVFGQYVHIQHGRNWFDAQMYCREKYMDLASVSSEEENQELIKTGDWGWIGLHRIAQLPEIWQWSDGEPVNFFKWETNQISVTKHCVRVRSNSWDVQDCSEIKDFYCQERIVLVKENKTWDEALEYCRSNYTGLLLNVHSATWLNLAAVVTQPVSVWTGLRFLDGEWFWLNGAQAGSLVSLPSCPVQTYRCGARNFNNSVWENRDCNEKLYFLCY